MISCENDVHRNRCRSAGIDVIVQPVDRSAVRRFISLALGHRVSDPNIMCIVQMQLSKTIMQHKRYQIRAGGNRMSKPSLPKTHDIVNPKLVPNDLRCEIARISDLTL